MTLTKAQLVDTIHETIGLPAKKSVEVVENLLEIIKQALEDGDDVLISGFGKFCINDKAKRRGKKSGHRRRHDAGSAKGRNISMFFGIKRKD